MPPLPNLATCKKLGFIVPSSNTAVEPLTTSILSSLAPHLSLHFTRIAVQTVGTDASSTSQFSLQALVAAAQLLADAHVDAILWNGTSGMWVGTDLAADELLAAEMTRATGVPCSTTTIATVEALKVLRCRAARFAVPYTEALARKLVEFFRECGFEVVGAARMDPTPESNVDIAKTEIYAIAGVVREAADATADAVVVACTNWPAAGMVEELEQETGVTIVDSIIVTAWLGLRMVGMQDEVAGWGKLMRMPWSHLS